MLFFFELFLFVLVMLTLALGEFVSRGLALTLWLIATAFALAGYVLARRSLSALAAGEAGPTPVPAPDETMTPAREQAHEAPEEGTPADEAPASADPTPLDQRWARTLLYNWRRANALLVLGAFAVAGWYWLAG